MNVNDISLVRYDIRQGRIIYCSRNMIYLRFKYRITSVPFFIRIAYIICKADIIPSVYHPCLKGTDIIEKTQDFPILSLFFWSGLRGSNPPPPPWQGGALPNELNPRKWCLRSESNQRHGDFQSPALPTELQRHIGGDSDGARTHDL